MSSVVLDRLKGIHVQTDSGHRLGGISEFEHEMGESPSFAPMVAMPRDAA